MTHRTKQLPQSEPTLHRSLWKKYSHWLYALVFPLYLAAFFIEEYFIDGSAPYWVSYIPLDDRIPFCEWWIVFYVMWYPLLGGVALYLALQAPQEFKRYMTYIGVTFFTSVVVFALFPNGQDLRPDLTTLGRDNLFIRLVGELYATDTNTNVCPSMHVTGSMAAVFAVFHNDRLRRSRWVPAVVCVLACLIAISTVTLKQHSLLDGLVAIPYALFFYRLIYWPARKRITSKSTL